MVIRYSVVCYNLAMNSETNPKVDYIELDKLKPLDGNPRRISADDMAKLRKSINDNPDYFEARPIIVSDRTGELVIIGGNMRYRAAKLNGLKSAPCYILHGLTEERERELIIRDNVNNGSFDWDMLANEWDASKLEDWGVKLPAWGENGDAELTGASNEDYKDFIDKFKPKLTTDDCYTPPAVFDAVESWVRKTYNISPKTKNMRPFKPGGDYKAEDYSGDVVVIDNPPFSIEADIMRYYLDKGVKFFMFAPALTLFSPLNGDERITRVVAFASIKYENGASVRTGFITNMEPGTAIRTSASLTKAINDAQPDESKELGKYRRPRNVKIASDFVKGNTIGAENAFTFEQVRFVRNIDAMKRIGKGLYGCGVLVSDDIADTIDREYNESMEQSRKAEAARLASGYELKLSEREQAIVDKLNKGGK